MDQVSIFKIRPRVSEVLFILAGVGILISLPLLGEDGLLIWFLAKIAYFLGVFFYVIKK